jgi:hypothetical protein
MKHYVAEARIPHHKLLKLMKGETITLKPEDVHDHSNHYVTLHFHKLKDRNRYARNIHNNKGFRLGHHHVADIQDESGGSIWGKIKHGFRTVGHALAPALPIVEKVGKVLAPVALGTAVGLATENPAMGAMSGQLLQRSMNGGKINTKKLLRHAGHAI